MMFFLILNVGVGCELVFVLVFFFFVKGVEFFVVYFEFFVFVFENVE